MASDSESPAAKAKTLGMAAYAAPSLFQPHRAREALRDAHERKIGPLLGFYGGISSIPAARIVATLGFDAFWLDWEHTACGIETMTTMVHDIMFMSGGKTIPFVRVPGHDHAMISYALDAGASVVIPQVDTVEQAKHVVAATKYGSKANGTRSVPPFRLLPGVTDTPFQPGADIHQCLNKQAAVMIQIESLEGIRNLDAILTEVKDIDAVWLGSYDCRLNMNLPGNFGMSQSEPEWLEAVQLLEDTIKKHDKPYAGFYMGGPDNAKEGTKKFCMSFVASDVTALLGQAGVLAATRAAIQ